MRDRRVRILAGPLLALAALAAAPAARAQDMEGGLQPQLTAAAAVNLEAPSLPERSDLVAVRMLADERVVEFDIGPVELPAGMDHLRLPIQLSTFPVDGWIHGFEARMVDGAGNEIPLDLLHHVNFIDPDKRELFSPIALRVMAAGRETVEERLPRLIGYPISEGDRLLIAAMFANPVGRDFRDAHLRVRFFYSAEEDGFVQPRNVYPFYLDVMGPVGVKDFPVPPGKSTRYWEGRPAVDGKILGLGGHLHDYATRLSLIDMTSGKTVWEARPEVSETGRVTGVPSASFIWTLGRGIFADHTYRIQVEYDNPLDVPAPDGGMGAIGGAVWVGKETTWPAFDRTNSAYVADLINTLRAPDYQHGHGSHSGMDGMDGMGDSEGAKAHSGHSH